MPYFYLVISQIRLFDHLEGFQNSLVTLGVASTEHRRFGMIGFLKIIQPLSASQAKRSSNPARDLHDCDGWQYSKTLNIENLCALSFDHAAALCPR